MTLTYAVERFDDALPAIEKLIPEHWAEVGSFKEQFAKHIDFHAYRALSSAGRLLTVTGRDTSGVLAAYIIAVLSNDMHRVTRTNPPKHVGIATALVYYVRPEYRGYAKGFVRAFESAATERGCSISSIRVKPGMNRADEFLSAIGYAETERVMTRLIGDAAHAGQSPPSPD